MKNSKFISLALAAAIAGMVTLSGCKHCPTCPPVTSGPCDPCYCPTPGIQIGEAPNQRWCCADTLSTPCMPDTSRFNTWGVEADYGYCDILIDSLIITNELDADANIIRVVTDIYIRNNDVVGDDDASCAKLEVLLPVETSFIDFKIFDADATQGWKFYDGYVRANLGQLSRKSESIERSKRHVQMITSRNGRTGVNSGIAAFVYSMVPDPCLSNNYAYGYYQVNDLSNCTTAKVLYNKVIKK